MTRRSFLASTAGLSLAAPNGKPWNFLWLSCEDTSPDLGCYGDSYARTPNIDRLAAESARFTRAFSTYGVCAPSRSSIITGMYPASIGTHHMRSQGVPPPEVKCFTEYLRAAGYYCSNNVKTDYNFAAPDSAWDESTPRAHYRKRAAGQPFFGVFNNTVTHESQIRASDEAWRKNCARLKPEEFHDPAKAVLPPWYPDTKVVRQDWARMHDNITAMDYWVGDMLKELEESGEAANTVVFFWGDHGRGMTRCKRWPWDSGTHMPLLVRWPGQLKAGSVVEDLVSLMDLGPTLLSMAGIDPPRHMQGRAFLGAKKAAPREYVFTARDRMDETYDMMRSVRDKRFRYVKNYQWQKPYAQYIDYMDQMPTLREMRRLHAQGKLTGPQKLFFAPEKPQEELYDIDNDKWEIKNLAGDPQYRPVLERMRGVHERFMKETGDLGLMPEDQLKERMRPGGVYQTTAVPTVALKGDTLMATCATPGSSIVYTQEEGKTPHWLLWSKPAKLSKGGRVRVKACRLGYNDSPETSIVYQPV